MMKLTWISLPLLLVTLLASLAACSQATTPAPVTQATASLPTTTPTALATPTLAPFPSPTITLTATQRPSPTATAHDCRLDPGRIELHELESSLLPKPMPFRVYLPPCYDQDLDSQYPVLYLIHGQSYNDDQWERLGAPAAADRLIAGGEVSPFLIVMPRDRELATEPDTNHFAEAVSQELVPWVDSHYRTQDTREARAVGGLSRGGGWALHLALSDWEMYGSFGGHSMAIFWVDTTHIKTWLNEIPQEELPRIFLDIGDHDRPELLNSVTWFESLLTQRGIPHEFHLYTGYHEEKYWEEHVEEYLRWYAAGFP